ncbi:stimulated by retinoic acid gene 6 protein-like isoform X2 [Oculina patagonica]
MALFLRLFQMFLQRFVFRDRNFPNIAINVDNKRLFSIMAYFFFFYNILLGVFSSVARIFKGMLLGVLFLSRIDRTSLMQGFQSWDPAFVAYLGFIHVLVAHSHPLLLMFCQLLSNRNKDRRFEESLDDDLPISYYQPAPGNLAEKKKSTTGKLSWPSLQAKFK